MKFTTLALASVAGVAFAQDDIDLSSVPTCAIQCALGLSMGQTDCDAADTACLCADKDLIATIAPCIKSQCSASDAQAAEKFFQDTCEPYGADLDFLWSSVTITQNGDDNDGGDDNDYDAPSSSSTSSSSSASPPSTRSSTANGAIKQNDVNLMGGTNGVSNSTGTGSYYLPSASLISVSGAGDAMRLAGLSLAGVIAAGVAVAL